MVGSKTRSNEWLTSLASKVDPSEKVTPWRSVKRQLPSSCCSHASASRGIRPWAPRTPSPGSAPPARAGAPAAALLLLPRLGEPRHQALVAAHVELGQRLVDVAQDHPTDVGAR